MASVTSPARPDDTGPDTGTDWSFTRRPFWLFSHVFALAVVVLFVNLGLWQLSRHEEREVANAAILARLDTPSVVVNDASGFGGPPSQLDYLPATVRGTFIDDDFVRIVNRSQGGLAGEHVVAIMELGDESLLAVNRGFVPANTDVELRPVPTGRVAVDGWLRESVSKGRFGADDSGEGRLMPRLDLDDLAVRLGRPVGPVWLQQADDAGVTSGGRFPDPVPPPEIDAGPHLAYAGQWFIFAALGVVFYGALLRRRSGGR